MTTLRLESQRLVLRRWRPEDLDPYATLCADPVVMQYLLPLPDRAAIDAQAQRFDQHFTQHGFGYWAVELPGITPFVGFVGLSRVTFPAHFTPAVEVGWRLDHQYWGAGYATEAAKLALDDGFNRLGLSEIVAITVPANQRSWQVMERLGMTRSAQDDFDYPLMPDGHPLQRHVLYRLRAHDWPGA